MMRDLNSPQYKKWRRCVFARDRYTCQFPGCFAKQELEAHHIKPWAMYPKLRFAVFNGLTLCVSCHDRVFGRESAYESIFEEIVQRKSRKRDSSTAAINAIFKSIL